MVSVTINLEFFYAKSNNYRNFHRKFFEVSPLLNILFCRRFFIPVRYLTTTFKLLYSSLKHRRYEETLWSLQRKLAAPPIPVLFTGLNYNSKFYNLISRLVITSVNHDYAFFILCNFPRFPLHRPLLWPPELAPCTPDFRRKTFPAQH